MNKQRVNEIILSPESLKYNSDLGVVNELIQSFPYFSTPYIMLSKMLHDENSIYFDKNLKISAAYVGDREILFNYIHSSEKPAPEYLKAFETSESISAKEPVIEPTQIPEIQENQSEKVILMESMPPVLVERELEQVKPSIETTAEIYKEKQQGISTFDLFQYPVSDYFGQYYKKKTKGSLRMNRQLIRNFRILSPVKKVFPTGSMSSNQTKKVRVMGKSRKKN